MYFSTHTQGQIKIHSINGDGTGLIQIDSGIRVLVADDQERSHIKSHVSLLNNGQLVTGPSIYTYENLYLYGKLYGADHIHLRGQMILQDTGFTACQGSNCNSAGSPAKFYFNSLTVNNGGKLHVSDSSARQLSQGITITSDKFEMEHSSTFVVQGTSSVYSAETEVEKSSTVNGNTYGYPEDSGPGQLELISLKQCNATARNSFFLFIICVEMYLFPMYKLCQNMFLHLSII